MKNRFHIIITLAALVLFSISCSSGQMSGKSNMSLKADGSVVSGAVVTNDNKPVQGAYVYLYSTETRGQMGPSDFISQATGKSGEFSIKVAAGEYFIIARKRADNSNVGVLVTGDFSSKTGEKIVVAKGTSQSINLSVDQIDEPMFFKKTGTEITDTGVKGIILDKDGNAVAGAFAIAYKDKSMKTLPDFASVPTQADGSYVLFLPDSGQYCIGARVNTKKPPMDGELYGTYNKTEDHSIAITKGSFVENVNVTLEPFKGSAKTDFKGFK